MSEWYPLHAWHVVGFLYSFRRSEKPAPALSRRSDSSSDNSRTRFLTAQTLRLCPRAGRPPNKNKNGTIKTPPRPMQGGKPYNFDKPNKNAISALPYTKRWPACLPPPLKFRPNVATVSALAIASPDVGERSSIHRDASRCSRE